MLRRELVMTLTAQAEATPGQPLTSIFFGGGTPTLLDGNVLAELLQVARDNIAIAPDAEISTEANPDGLDEAKLATLRAAGWNRLSLGAQSFDDVALQRLGRTHTAAQIETVFAAARRVGFDNISVDLMFALPGQDHAAWHDTLARAAALEPEHISCYALTIEAGTPFARRVARGQLLPLEDETQVALMQEAQELLQSAGLLRYEVSNYARAGRECQHNLNYWRGGDYLACGCGAHGHRQGHRWWNERSAPGYVELMREQGTARTGEERLNSRERLGEIVMLGLRLREGFSLADTSQRLNLDARRALNGELRDLTGRGLLLEQDGIVRLAPAAIPVADAVAARLMPF